MISAVTLIGNITFALGVLQAPSLCAYIVVFQTIYFVPQCGTEPGSGNLLISLFFLVADADIIIAALGKAEFMTSDWIKPGAAVIDVGINAVDDPTSKKGYRLVGT